MIGACRRAPRPVAPTSSSGRWPTRRDILDMLLGGERTVAALAERFDMARPSVSEHLKVLRDCGLVAEDKHGRFRHYRANPEPLQEISAWLSPHERYWRERLRALGEVLDDVAEQEKRSS
jgi:DNA-binding transcriptional ArsR family regulator